MSNTLNPKQRFLANPNAAKHQEWCRSEVGKAAIEAALSEMALSLNTEEISRLPGAIIFARILLNLAEPDAPRKPIESATLKYDQPQPKPQKSNAT